MNIKKFTFGAWITCLSAILSVIALIIYTISVKNEGYFQNQSVSNLLLYVLVAAVLFVGAIVVAQLGSESSVVPKLLSGIMQVVAPVLVVASAISLIAARVEGMGFILFSNPEVLKEVQTPANLTSVNLTIATIALLVVTMIFGWIGAFCNLKKK